MEKFAFRAAGQEHTIYYNDRERQSGAEKKTGRILHTLGRICCGDVPPCGGLVLGPVPTFYVRIKMKEFTECGAYRDIYDLSAHTGQYSPHKEGYVDAMMQALSMYPEMGYTGSMPTSRLLGQLRENVEKWSSKDLQKYPVLSTIKHTELEFPMSDQLPPSVRKQLSPLKVYWSEGGVCFIFDDSTLLNNDEAVNSGRFHVYVAFHGEDAAGRLNKPQFQPYQQYFALFIMKGLMKEVFPILYPETVGPVTNYEDFLENNPLTATFMNCLGIKRW